MKKLVFFIVALALSVNIFANGLSLNSIGPKALGMGGAFIGLADDPTAIYWNQAGLSWQANGVNVSVADIMPLAAYKYTNAAMGIDIDTDAEPNHNIAPNLFVNYNVDKFSLGFGIYVPAGLGVEWKGKDLLGFNGPPIVPTAYGNVTNPFAGSEMEWMSKLGVIDFSPAISYKFSDKLAVGLAANMYYGMLEMKRGTDLFNLFNPDYFGTPVPGEDGMLDTQSEVDVSGLGFGGAVSMMFKASEKFNFGLSFRTPVNIKFEGDGKLINGIAQLDETFDVDLELEYPIWFGGGIAFMPSEKFTITADAQYSQWSSLEIVDVTMKLPDTLGGETVDEMVLDWNDATQFRFGVEYKATDCMAVRAGFYTDPAPAPDETLTILFPSGTYSVLTGGLGYAKNNIAVDFGIEYLLGEDREIEADEHNMPGTHMMDIVAFAIGLGYKF